MKQTIGVLLVLILASGVAYVTLQDQGLKIRVDNDKSTFYVFNEDTHRWNVGGREYNKLLRGNTLQYRDLQKGIIIDTNINEVDETVTIRRFTPYKYGAEIIDTWFFAGNITNVEQVPTYHTVEVFNGTGLYYKYEVRDLTYDGDTFKLDGKQTSMNFGKNMKVSWWEGYRLGWIYSSGSMYVKSEKITSDYVKFNVRLFDPLGATVAVDTFEDGNINANPVWNGGTGYFSAQTDTVAVGSYSALFNTSGRGTSAYVDTTFTQVEPSNISFWARTGNVTRDVTYIISDNSNHKLMWMNFDGYEEATANISVLNSGSLLELAPIVVDAWYFMELKNIDYTAQTYDIYINDSLKASDVIFSSSNPNTRADGFYRFQMDLMAGGYGLGYLDDIKYTLREVTTTNLYLNGVSSDRYNEHGSVVEIKANATNSTGSLITDFTSTDFCLTIDAVGFGTDYLCDTNTDGVIEYNWTSFASLDELNDSSTEKNITYYSDAAENQTIYLQYNKYDNVINASCNLTGFETNGSYPNTVKIYINETLSNEFVSELKISGGSYSLDEFNDSTTEINVTFSTAGSDIVYVELPQSATITSAYINMTGFNISKEVTQLDSSSSFNIDYITNDNKTSYASISRYADLSSVYLNVSGSNIFDETFENLDDWTLYGNSSCNTRCAKIVSNQLYINETSVGDTGDKQDVYVYIDNPSEQRSEEQYFEFDVMVDTNKTDGGSTSDTAFQFNIMPDNTNVLNPWAGIDFYYNGSMRIHYYDGGINYHYLAQTWAEDAWYSIKLYYHLDGTQGKMDVWINDTNKGTDLTLGSNWASSRDVWGYVFGVAAGQMTAGGEVYVDNFEVYNGTSNYIYIDGGSSGTYEWNYSQELNDSITQKTSDIKNGMQTEVDSCTSNDCDISILFNGTRGHILVDDINITYIKNPENPYIDVSSDYDKDWEFSGEFNQSNNRTSDLSSEIQDYLDNVCTPDDSGLCEVPIVVGSDSNSVVGLSDLEVNYTVTFNPVSLDEDLIQTYLDNSVAGDVNVPITFESQANGTIQIDDIKSYYYGSDNVTITASFSQNENYTSSSDTQDAMVVYSNISIEKAYEYMEWFPDSLTEENVTPYRQSDDTPYWNITPDAYDQKFNISIYLNETLPSCINMTLSTDSSKDNGTLISISDYQYITDMNITGSGDYNGIWFWVDLVACNRTELEALVMANISYDCCCADCVNCGW